MDCYRRLHDGDVIDVETKTAERLDDGVAVSGQTAVRLVRFRLHLDRKLLSGKTQAGGDRAEVSRVELDLQDMCRNGNRDGRVRADRSARVGLLNAAVRGDRLGQRRYCLAEGVLGRRGEALLADHIQAPGGGGWPGLTVRCEGLRRLRGLLGGRRTPALRRRCVGCGSLRSRQDVVLADRHVRARISAGRFLSEIGSGLLGRHRRATGSRQWLAAFGSVGQHAFALTDRQLRRRGLADRGLGSCLSLDRRSTALGICRRCEVADVAQRHQQGQTVLKRSAI